MMEALKWEVAHPRRVQIPPVPTSFYFHSTPTLRFIYSLRYTDFEVKNLVKTRLSLAELTQELERQKANSKDIVAPTTQLKAVPDDGKGIVLQVPEPKAIETVTDVSLRSPIVKEHGLTNYAHQQLSQKTQIPWKYYERMKNAGAGQLLADNINRWLPDKDRRLIRILDGEVRAVLSDRYRPIDHYDLVWAFLDMAKKYGEHHNTEFQIQKADLSETHMYVRALLPTMTEILPGDTVQAMLLLRNSEVGAGRMGLSLGMWRLVCKNGQWREDVVKRIHLGSKLDEGVIEWSEKTLKLQDQALFSQLQDAMRQALDPVLWEKYVTEAQRAAGHELEPTAVEIVNNIAPKLKVSENEKKKLLDYFSSEIGQSGKTQWALANGVTAMARDIANDDPDRAVELEVIGGDLTTAIPEKVKKLVSA